MSTECYPISTLFPTTKLFRDFLAMDDAGASSPVRSWYGAQPLAGAWMQTIPQAPALPAAHREALADALDRQSRSFGAGPETLANIGRLRNGARALVTGQQVGLFGGPLLTLLKAATAVARARQAQQATGIDHVPVFWLATEDHDLPEVNQVALLSRHAVETLRVSGLPTGSAAPVGDVPLGSSIDQLLEQASELLGYGPVSDLLRESYGPSANDPNPTFASGFARLLIRLFAAHGLIVLDASGPDFHRLGAPVLRHAIEHAPELEAALLARTAQLERDGYHAQVLVKPGASLLFLVTGTGAQRTRHPLRRTADGLWKTGNGTTARVYSTSELLDLLAQSPERLSPNALLRPVFQDLLLPTSAYVGGPAEIAYFAQSAVLYQQILGRITPILPRLSATLVEPAVEAVMAAHELTFPDVLTTPEALAQRLGVRAMPIEGKRRLSAAGNALDEALQAATSYLSGLDDSLGRSADVSASKMRYQMNRLRRLAANFELQRETSLRKHADAITLHLYPEGHPQERLLAGVHFCAAWHAAHPDAPAAGLIDLLVAEAANLCPGHLLLHL